MDPAPARLILRGVVGRFFRGLRAIAAEAIADDVPGEAAKVAYYAFLSFWPLLLGLFAFTGIFGGDPAFEWIMGSLRRVLPGEAPQFLETFLRRIVAEERPDMLSLGVLLTLWSGSNIFASLAQGLNVVYDVPEGRTWWRRRALSVFLLVVGIVVVTACAGAILAGSELATALGMERAVSLVRVPLPFLLVAAFLWILYTWLPARDQALAVRYVTVGALVGASLWTAITWLFRFYVTRVGSYETYGIVGAVIVLLLWLYLAAVVILFGGEVAVSLEQGVHVRRERRKAKRSEAAAIASR